MPLLIYEDDDPEKIKAHFDRLIEIKIDGSYSCRQPISGLTYLEFESKAEYFRLAGRFYYCYSYFEKPLHKEVWRLHAQGKFKKEIAECLSLSRRLVERIVRRYAQELRKGYWDCEKEIDGL